MKRILQYFYIWFWHFYKEFSIENNTQVKFHIEASKNNMEWRIYMEKDVGKFLKEKGKSEQFINLILKICKNNNIKEDKCIEILKKQIAK